MINSAPGVLLYPRIPSRTSTPRGSGVAMHSVYNHTTPALVIRSRSTGAGSVPVGRAERRWRSPGRTFEFTNMLEPRPQQVQVGQCYVFITNEDGGIINDPVCCGSMRTTSGCPMDSTSRGPGSPTARAWTQIREANMQIQGRNR